jgi:hypothetical protein
MGDTIYLKDYTADKLKGPLEDKSGENIEKVYEEKFKLHLLGTDRAKSAKAYLDDVGRFENWVINHYEEQLNPKAVTTIDIVEYRDFLQKQP